MHASSVPVPVPPVPAVSRIPVALSDCRTIGSVSIAVAEEAEAIAFLKDRVTRGRFTRLAFANAHCVNVAADDEDYRSRLAGFTVLADGIGVDLASKALYGTPFPDNLNGTDFVPRLLASLPGERRIALVGAGPGVAELAAQNFRALLPRHEFQVISDGCFREGLQTEIVLARLRRFSPDVTIVALGVPKQELFIARHLTIRETTVAIGVGALLDFMSGRIVRAPRIWRAMRLEWVFRLLLEPSRMWRRYLIGNLRFLFRVLVDRARARRRARAARA